MVDARQEVLDKLAAVRTECGLLPDDVLTVVLADAGPTFENLGVVPGVDYVGVVAGGDTPRSFGVGLSDGTSMRIVLGGDQRTRAKAFLATRMDFTSQARLAALSLPASGVT